MARFYNKTKISKSIPRKLIAEGKFYLLPVYYLLLTSYLSEEGIKNSGSYEFADHIYNNKPKGKYIIGIFLDKLLLNLSSAKSMRLRYTYAKNQIKKLIIKNNNKIYLDILIVPCGLSRELFETIEEIEKVNTKLLKKVRFFGLDLDKKLVTRLKSHPLANKYKIKFLSGDAMRKNTYPKNQKYDLVVSNGFTEFLDDKQVVNFFQLIYNMLKRNGTFFTTSMDAHKVSEYLMSTFAELKAYYRSVKKLKYLAKSSGFKKTKSEKVLLLNILTAKK